MTRESVPAAGTPGKMPAHATTPCSGHQLSSMKAGVLAPGDPKLTTRQLLGMVIWVSRWYRPAEKYTADQISEAVMALIAPRSPR